MILWFQRSLALPAVREVAGEEHQQRRNGFRATSFSFISYSLVAKIAHFVFHLF